MTNGRSIPAMMLPVIIAAAAGLGLLPASAAADDVTVFCADFPTGDSDGDGFPNAWECADSHSLPDPSPSPGGSISRCTGLAGEDRQSCYDPRSPDVYVIVQPVPASTSCPSPTLASVVGLFDPLINATGGLGWAAVHPILSTQVGSPGRCVNCGAPRQGAALVAESCDTSDSYTGVFIGSIDGGGTAIIYTERMKARLTSAGFSGTALTDKLNAWVPHTVCQELNHGAGNRNPLDRRTGDNHYSVGSDRCLDSDVICKTKGGVTSCTIGLTNTDADRSGWDLDVLQ